MTRVERPRDETTPTLFPFLAVLLCTMGSLVLLLMLIVSVAQSTSDEIVEQARLEQEEIVAQIELARDAYREQLEEGHLELERKRLELEHLESHIDELAEELDRLHKSLQIAESENNQQNTEEEYRRRISELERQLAEAMEKLKLQKKAARPDGDKPIFAIIPYQGPNGTHRRPIYLECTADGVVIQPENILLTLEDLQPPYGPGNPLDAALRAIRTEFKPANGAITETAYPLLIVRPSGVRSYAMARAAMSGWDDQFGYELVDDSLELTYPESKPGLAEKIVRAIEAARQRQAALVMAMPGKYRGLLPGGDLGRLGAGANGGPRDRFGQPGDAHGGALMQGDMTGRGQGNVASGVPGAANRSPGTGMPGGHPGTTPPGTPGVSNDSRLGGALRSNGGGGPLSADGYGATPQRSDHQQSSSPTISHFAIDATNAQSHGSPGAGQGSTPSGDDQSIGYGSAAARPGDRNGTGNPASMQAGATAMSAGSAGPSVRGAGGNQNSPSTGGAGGASGSAASMSGGTPIGSLSADGSTERSAPIDPSVAANAVGLSIDRSASAPSPSIRSASRHWSWYKGLGNRTEIVRPIRIDCRRDRWIVLPEDGGATRTVTIAAGASPDQLGAQLSAILRQRVEGWGMAVLGGVWKPVLEIHVAPDAEDQFKLLSEILRGSGLEVVRVTGHKP